MKSFFTPGDVIVIVGISYRQIQYWDNTNFIKPSYRRKGLYRLYTFADLIQLEIAKFLREHDYSIQHLRKIIRSLRSLFPQFNYPLVEMTILINKDDILVFNGDVLMNSRPNYIRFDVMGLRDKVDRLFPPPPEEVPYLGSIQ